MREPLLLLSDQLGLPSDFAFDAGRHTLHDTQLNTTHLLQPEAAIIVKRLASAPSYVQLSRACANAGLSSATIRQGLSELNAIGALRVTRTLRARTHAIRKCLTHRSFGIRYSPVIWRRKSHIGALAHALLRASFPLWILASLATLVLVTTAFPLHTAVLFLSYAEVSVILFLSALLHEYAHLVCVQRYTRQCIVVQSGSRVGLLHRRLTPHQEIRAALCGPLVGAMVCLIAACLPIETAVRMLAAAGTILHIGSLLPLYGDGQTLYNILIHKGAA